MNHIALHILQPVPTSCLNRDDVGAPKNVIFGGVTRARVSSQCWKRPIRMLARELSPDYFAGERTLRAAEDLTKKLTDKKVQNAGALAAFVCERFLSKSPGASTSDEESEESEESSSETSTLLYFSPGEISAMAEAVAGVEAKTRTRALETPPKSDKKAAKEIQKAAKAIQDAAASAAKKFTRKDAADIAIFGRMVANDPSLNIEGASLFAHAISTHKCDNNLDFWTAVDDRKDRSEGAGAANMGHAEFNAACYYRYIGLNLELLADAQHLKAIGKESRQQVLRAFLRAALLAMPSANKTGKNADCFPEFALGLISTGQPFQLVNAFESPVRANGHGWLQPSVQALETHFTRMKKVFGLQNLIREEVRLSEETPLDQFIEKLVTHVH